MLKSLLAVTLSKQAQKMIKRQKKGLVLHTDSADDDQESDFDDFSVSKMLAEDEIALKQIP